MGMLNLSKVISYSKAMCVPKSMALCATYVKKAFQAGGLKYVSGNGWNNQRWCQTNDFKLIGDFVPEGKNPRNPARTETENICNVKGLQFPRMANGDPYQQIAGDVCLIQHGEYGHICYAMSTDINDWVSDYFQHSPGQRDGTGPYCYQGNITRVQFWRHSSIDVNTPPIDPTTIPPADNVSTSNGTTSGSSGSSSSTNVQELSSMNSDNGNKRPGTVLGTHIRQN